jgi:hypothetical protein
MAATGNPIGVYLRDQQEQSLEKLWTGIHAGHLLPALTPKWFFGTFTDLDLDRPAGKAALDQAEANPQGFEAVWRQVTKFNLYDPLALLAATPGVGVRLFREGVLPGVLSPNHRKFRDLCNSRRYAVMTPASMTPKSTGFRLQRNM